MKSFAHMYRDSFNVVNGSKHRRQVKVDPVMYVITRKQRNKSAKAARRINRQ